MKNPDQKKAWKNGLNKSGTFLSVLAVNLSLLLLASGLVVYHFVAPRTEQPMVFTQLKTATPPPPKPPSMSGRSGAKTLTDPVAVVAPPPSTAPNLITSSLSVSNFSSLNVQSSNSVDLPQVSLPQGTSLDTMSSVSTAPFDATGSNAFGSPTPDNGPALIGYLYDMKRNSDGTPTNIKDDGYFKDRTLEHTYEARWHWGRYVMSFANDPAKRDQLSDSMINEAKLVSTLLAEKNNDSTLEPYYRSKPLYAYQWSIAAQSPADIVKAFGVEKEVQPTHIVIYYKGMVTAPRDGTFRFVCFSYGGVMAIRFNGALVAGHGSGDNPLITYPPSFRFGADDAASQGALLPGESGGKWFRVVQGNQYPIEILLTEGAGGTSLHLMMQEKTPDQPYQPATFSWDVFKQRPNPRTPLKYPLFALRTGVPQAPFFPITNTNPPPDEAPDDVKQSFERNGPGYRNPEVAPDPIVFPGVPVSAN